MPALKNLRHEAFAQAIFIGIFRPDLYPTHGSAYNAAGYRAKNARKPGGAAEANASRLLKNAKIAELQQEAAQDAKETVDKCVQELNQLRGDSHSYKAYGAAVSAVMGKAKLLGFITDKTDNTHRQAGFENAKSMRDIGIGLLAQVGHSAPSDADIDAAIEANDVLVATLEAIRDRAAGAVAQ